MLVARHNLATKSTQPGADGAAKKLQQQIAAKDKQLQQLKAQVAAFTNKPAGSGGGGGGGGGGAGGGTKKVCCNMRDFGSCKHGDACTWDHDKERVKKARAEKKAADAAAGGDGTMVVNPKAKAKAGAKAKATAKPKAKAGADKPKLSAKEKKKIPCKWHQQGACKKGDKCDMSHAYSSKAAATSVVGEVCQASELHTVKRQGSSSISVLLLLASVCLLLGCCLCNNSLALTNNDHIKI